MTKCDYGCVCGCECGYPIFKKRATFNPEEHLSIVAVSNDRSSAIRPVHARPDRRRRAAPVRAIVFTSDSLSLIFNKPTRGKQNKSPRLIVCGSADRRGAARRGPVCFRIDSSFSLRRRFRRSRRYGPGTHGYLFEQLIYNPRKYTAAATPGHRGGLRRNANNYASVLIAVIKPSRPIAGVGAHKSRAGGITYDELERAPNRLVYKNRGRLPVNIAATTIGVPPRNTIVRADDYHRRDFAWGEEGSERSITLGSR